MRRLAALLLCLVAFGAACSRTSSSPAATVNGAAISTKELVDELDAIAANRDYINSLQGSTQTGGITVLGSTPGSFDAAFVAQALLRQMDYALIHSEVNNRHLTIDDACRLQAKNDAKLNLAAGQDPTSGDTLFGKFPQKYQDLLVQRNAEVLALEGALSGVDCAKGVDAQGYYNAHPEEFTKVCVSLIAVNDPAQADALVAQARAGADFAALVRDNSVDDTSKATDGAIGCRLPSEFNPTVAALLKAAKTGDVLDPIQGQAGVSIVKVTDRQLAPLSDVQSQAEELATSSAGQALTTWIQQARAGARVSVDPRYGTFDPAAYRINPPALDAANSSSNPP